MAKKNREYIISITPPVTDHYLFGHKTTVSARIVNTGEERNIRYSSRAKTKTVKVSSDAFEPSEVTLTMKRYVDVEVGLKESAIDSKIAVELLDFDETSTGGNYTAKWGDGFDKKGRDAAKNDTAESDKLVARPWAEIAYKAPSARKPFKAGETVQVTVTVEKKRDTDTQITFEGEALESAKIETFVKNKTSRKFNLPLTSESNIEKPNIKISEFGPHLIPDPSTTEHPTDIVIDYRTWKMQFAGEPVNDTNGTTTFYRGDQATLNVSFTDVKEALVADKGKVEILYENGKPFCDPVEFDITKDAAVVIPLTPDHTAYPIHEQAETETITFKLLAADSSTRLLKEEHATKDLTLKRFALSLGEEPVNANDEHGKLFFFDDTAKITLKMLATASHDFSGEIRFHVPGPDQPKTSGDYYYPGGKPFSGVLAAGSFDIVAGTSDLETVVPVVLKMADGITPYTEPKTLTAAIHIKRDAYAFVDGSQSVLSNFKLDALPTVRFDVSAPVVGRSSLEKTEGSGEQALTTTDFKLSTGIRHKVKLTRSETHKDIFVSDVKLVGPHLEADVPVSFPKNELEAEAEIILKDTSKAAIKPVAVESVKNCQVLDDGRKIQVIGAPEFLYLDGDWLFPAGLPAAPGDQVWIRFSKDGIEAFHEDEAIFAFISCEAFEEGGPYTNKFPVYFQKDKNVSEIVAVDKTKPKEGLRIRTQVNSRDIQEKAYCIAIVTVDVNIDESGTVKKQCKVDGISAEIEVKRRFGYFSQSTDIDSMDHGQAEVPVTLNMNHPARINTRFVLTSNYCKKAYKVGIKPSQGHLTFNIDLDEKPDPWAPVALDLRRYSGNIIEPPDGDEADKYPKRLEPTYIIPVVGFHPQDMIDGTYVRTGRKKYPTFHVGDTFKLKMVLDRVAIKEGSKITVSCTAFYEYDDQDVLQDQHSVDVVFDPGESEKLSDEVEIRNSRAKTTTVRLVPEYTNILVADAPGNLSEFKININPLPDIHFGKEGQSPGTDWIDPPDVPFMVGEEAKVYLSLNAPNKSGQAITGKINSPVLEKNYTFTINDQKSAPESAEYPLTVKFKKKRRRGGRTHLWGKHPMEILLDGKSKKRCFKSDASEQYVNVFEKRIVQFHGNDPITPRGPFVPNEFAVVRLVLNHPAPDDRTSERKRVTVELSGSFFSVEGYVDESAPDTVTPTTTGNKIEFPYQTDSRTVKIKLTGESETKDNFSLAANKNSELNDDFKSLTVLVKEPDIAFDQEAWDAYDDAQRAFTPGRTVSLPFKLEKVAPASGCTIVIKSDAFADSTEPVDSGDKKKYKLVFSEDDNRFNAEDLMPLGNEAVINIQVDTGFEIPEDKKVTIAYSDPHNCKAPSAATTITLPVPPEIAFAKTDYPAIYQAGVEGQDKATLQVMALQSPETDINVRLKSSAFGANLYMVKIPRESTDPYDVEVMFIDGTQNPTAQPSEVEIIPPTGWVAAPVSREKTNLELKVKAPAEPEMVVPCSGTESDTQTESERRRREERRQELPEETCNLRRMVLTVRHGDHLKNEPDRGPFKDGRFEIVRKAGNAENSDYAMVCSTNSAPIIQVTGERPKGDPNIINHLLSKHYTEVVVSLDDEDKFCPHRYILNGKPYIHPFVFVHERSLDNPDHASRNPLKQNHEGLLGPVADPHAPSIYVRREDETRRYDWAPLHPELDVNYSDHSAVAALPVYRAHQRIDTSLDQEFTGRLGGIRRYFNDAFSVLKNLGQKDIIQQYLIEVQSCAVPDVGKSYGPAKSLKAVVEVFPSAEYCFFIGLGEKGDTVMEHLQEGTFIGPTKKTNLLGETTTVKREFNPEKEFDLNTLIKSSEDIQAAKNQLEAKLYDRTASPDPPFDPFPGNLGNQDETPAHFNAKLNITVEAVNKGAKTADVKIDLSPPIKVDAKLVFESEALAPSPQDVDISRDRESVTVQLNLKPEEDWEDGANISFLPLLGYATDSGETELELTAGEKTATDEEEDVQEPETVDDEDTAGEPKEFVFRSRLVNPEGAEPESFEGIEYSSKIFYPYNSGDALADLEYEHDDWKFERESPTDKWDWDKPADESSKLGSKGLDTMIGKACLGKIADLNLHIGINGGQQDPKSADRIRKGLFGALRVILSIADLINKKDFQAGAGYGFSFGFKLTFLKGHYVKYWGWKECSDHRVFWWTYHDLDMHLIGIQLELLFGVGYGFCGMKIEAVIFGSFQGDLNVTGVIEKNEPAAENPVVVHKPGGQKTGAKPIGSHLDGWVEVFTEFKGGVRIVVGNPSWFSFEAALQAGFTFRLRVIIEYGADMEIYFNGLSAYVEVQFLVIFCWKGEKTIIKGNVAGWPAWSGTIGGSGERRLTEVNRALAQVQARIDYMRRRFSDHLLKYQEVQVLMIADKKVPVEGERYPFTVLLPGYKFIEGENYVDEAAWNKNKRVWERQWTLCKRAFNQEQKRVPRRSKLSRISRGVDLKTRLNDKVRDIEKIIAAVITPRLRAVDRLETKLETLQKRVADMLNRSAGSFDTRKGDAFFTEAQELKKDPAIAYRDMRSGDLKKMGERVKDLVHYAKFREKW